MAEFEYVWERAYGAVRSLALGREDLAGRISDAYLTSLIGLDPRSDFGTDEIRRAYEDIVARISSDEQGAVDQRLAQLDDTDLHGLANDILDLFVLVEREDARRSSIYRPLRSSGGG